VSIIQELYKQTIKIVVLGDKNVGKSTFSYKYMSGDYIDNLKSSIGTTVFTKPVKSSRHYYLKLELWDFAGEERFNFLIAMHAEGVNGVILMYDITNNNSFSNLGEWVSLIRGYLGDAPIMLIGTKLDLEDKRAVSKIMGLDVVKKLGLFPFFEVSAKSGENVERSLHNFLKLLPILDGKK
jgi:Ras-related protein Rab-1A